MNGVRALKASWVGARVAAQFSTRLAGFFAWRLWFTPWRVGLSERAAQREAQWLAATTPIMIGFRGRTLRGFTSGVGPTVLLVHGWGDRGSRLGAFIEPLVEAGFRVVGVDLPAHGDSPGRRTNAYELADAIRASADEVGGVTAVIAHSMGGVETLLALRNGLAAERVVLLASAVRLEHATEKFEQMFNLPSRAMIGLRNAIERRFGPSVWDDLSSDLLAADLDVPALLFHDRDDAQVDFADGELLVAAWPGARFIPTQGLGHDRLLRDPEVIRGAVSFLSAVESGDAQQPVAAGSVATDAAPSVDRSPADTLR